MPRALSCAKVYVLFIIACLSASTQRAHASRLIIGQHQQSSASTELARYSPLQGLLPEEMRSEPQLSGGGTASADNRYSSNGHSQIKTHPVYSPLHGLLPNSTPSGTRIEASHENEGPSADSNSDPNKHHDQAVHAYPSPHGLLPKPTLSETQLGNSHANEVSTDVSEVLVPYVNDASVDTSHSYDANSDSTEVLFPFVDDDSLHDSHPDDGKNAAPSSDDSGALLPYMDDGFVDGSSPDEKIGTSSPDDYGVLFPYVDEDSFDSSNFHGSEGLGNDGLGDSRRCAPGLLPQQCVVVPGPKGNEWQEQLKATGCHGNVITVLFSQGNGDAYPGFVGLRVFDTHDLSDLDRAVPSGLNISMSHTGSWWNTEGIVSTLIVEHTHLNLNLALIAGARYPSPDVGLGATTLLDHTQKLAVRRHGDYFSWETSTRSSLLKNIGQVVGIALLPPLPETWYRAIDHHYGPAQESTIPLPIVQSVYVRRCRDGSFDHAHMIDEADEEPDDADSDDDSDGSDSVSSMESVKISGEDAYQDFKKTFLEYSNGSDSASSVESVKISGEDAYQDFKKTFLDWQSNDAEIEAHPESSVDPLADDKNQAENSPRLAPVPDSAKSAVEDDAPGLRMVGAVLR